MAELLSQLFNGLVLGLLFGVMALGFMLILSVMEVINFSHGALFALGAYFALSLQKFVGYWPALILAPVFVGLLGLAIERFGIRRIYGKDPLFGLLLTLGLAMAFEEIIRMIWGKAGSSLAPPAFAAGPIDLGYFWYSKYLLFLAVLSMILLFLVWLFLEKTPYGSIIKAGVSDSEMVLALGKNLEQTSHPGIRPGRRSGRHRRSDRRSHVESQADHGNRGYHAFLCGGGHRRDRQFLGGCDRGTDRGAFQKPEYSDLSTHVRAGHVFHHGHRACFAAPRYHGGKIFA